jgi:hypothetical protein
LKDPVINEKMKQMGAKLNLKPHIQNFYEFSEISFTLTHKVGPLDAPVEVTAAVDVEVHKGLDGRHYVIDLSR